MKFSVNTGDNYKINLVTPAVRKAEVVSNGADLFDSSSDASETRSNVIVKNFNNDSIHVGETPIGHEFTMHVKVEKVDQVDQLLVDNELSLTPHLKTTVESKPELLYSYLATNVEKIVTQKSIELEHYNGMVMSYVTGDVAVNIGSGESQINLEPPTIINDDGTVQFGSIIIEAEMQKYHDCLVQLPSAMVNTLVFIEVIDLPAPLTFDTDTYTLKGYVNFGEVKNIKFKFDKELVISCTIKPVMKSNVRNKRDKS